MKTIPLVALLFAIPLASFAQLTNEGFEDWRMENGTERPNGWTGSSFGSGKNSSAHSGRYAVAVWNWYFGALGSVTSGEFDLYNFGFNDAGVPLDVYPAKLTGYYRYELGDNAMVEETAFDSAAVHVTLLRYNAATGEADTIADVTRLLPPAEDWVAFEVDLPSRMPGVLPDTAVITFYSSNPANPAFCGSESGTCCFLSIDDVELVRASGVRHPLKDGISPTRVVPNPVVNGSARLSFNGESGRTYTVKIHDAAGELVLEREVIGSEVDLTDLDLPTGSYLATVIDDAGVPAAAGRFVVE